MKNTTIKKDIHKCGNFCKTKYLNLRQKKLIEFYKTNKNLRGTRSKKEIQKLIKNIKDGNFNKEDIINSCMNMYCNEKCKKNCICPICKKNFDKFQKYGVLTASPYDITINS